LSGGTDTGTTIDSEQDVYIGGLATSDTVGSGGYQAVFGTASATTVSSDGTQWVESGGIASGGTVLTGGTENVLSGGTLTNVTISGTDSSAKVEVFTGGQVGSSTVTFASGGAGTLVLDQSVAFTGFVAGFGSGFGSAVALDLRDINFATATATGSGTNTLTVTDHVNSAVIQMVNTLGALTLQNDGRGGTLVTDPALTTSNGQAPQLAQHA
jgi:autotransporter passenger strand-loop-strand repeat protein